MQRNLYSRFLTVLFRCVLFTTSLVFALTSTANAQNSLPPQIIKGTVTDAVTKEPLIGVSVGIKGTGRGAVTDTKGNYTITVSPGVTLTFSYIGYKTASVLISNQTALNITLQQSAGMLQDVVVTALGQTKEERSIGYSLSTVPLPRYAKTAWLTNWRAV